MLELLPMDGTVGSRPTGWVNASGSVERLRVSTGSTTFSSPNTTPRSGTTLFQYATGGSGFSSDFYEVALTAGELSDVAGGNATLTYQAFGRKDNSVDGDVSQVGVEFVDSSDSVISSVWGTAVNLGTSEFGLDQWWDLSLAALSVPSSTASVRFYVRTEVFGQGSTPNTFWDDLGYTLETPAPILRQPVINLIPT